MIFDSYLGPDEKVLWRGKGTPSKTGKGIGGALFIFVFCLLILCIMIYSIKSGKLIGTGEVIMIVAVILFLALGVYMLIFNLFIKNMKIKNLEYCLTEKKAMVYDTAKEEMKIGYLDRLTNIVINNEKNDYGDLLMRATPQIENNSNLSVDQLKDAFAIDNNNMNSITFFGIGEVVKVKSLVTDAQKKLNDIAVSE